MTSDEPASPPPIEEKRGLLPVSGAIFNYLAAIFVIAPLVAPWIFNWVQNHAAGSYLAGQPFHRYVNRCLIVTALVGLWPLSRVLRRNGWTWRGLGLRARYLPDAGAGFLWGFGTLAIAAAFAIFFGARTLDLNHDAAAWLKHLRNAALAAVLVGFVEELLFRGAFFGGLRRQEGFVHAALASSAIYGIVHFMERPSNPDWVTWFSGFGVLAQMLRGWTDWHALIPGLLNLTLIGLILCLAFERTRSLMFSFGMHAGLIFWVKSYGFVTRVSPEANPWLWGGDKLVDGWASGGLLLLVFVLLARALPRRPQ